MIYYFLVCNKKSRFDFADELKIGDVRYKHLTQITIKVYNSFDVYHMKCNFP